ncbi:MAG: PIN domain-containing protein [Planctomycetota bacterium]
MSRFLLDTCTVSMAMRPDRHRDRLTKLASIEASSAFASVTLSELRFGSARLPEGGVRDRLMAAIDELAKRFSILSFDATAAEWHADQRARLERLGRRPPFADGQIAAVAAANDLTLVTLNAADFEPFDGLRVESW